MKIEKKGQQQQQTHDNNNNIHVLRLQSIINNVKKLGLANEQTCFDNNNNNNSFSFTNDDNDIDRSGFSVFNVVNVF
ncbi:hypothetical protein DERP_010265 [Dermatophagoides pteronyssinus]|uniref:Uncharacterized protein n=1 Tax=Dermatophagoides pteronyssinus TaxID=6956 RepID=A0ABQ8J754_DERPT|nr:hypothetical protein DERP_010265 [Dermatophagoides pteronyssinus]